MEDKGKLLYEEDIKERRAQAELNSNHIGMYVCSLTLTLTWIIYGVRLTAGISAAWISGGFLLCLIITGISLLAMDKFKRMEVARTLPIKVYENGILMPTTLFDRTLWRRMFSRPQQITRGAIPSRTTPTPMRQRISWRWCIGPRPRSISIFSSKLRLRISFD